MCYAELGNLFAAGEGGDPDSGIWFFKQVRWRLRTSSSGVRRTWS